MSKQTAFVAGATGYTGREVVRVLCERGASVVAHVRPDSGGLAEWRERFASLGAETDTTPWDEAAMTASLRARAPTLVYALLGTTRSRMKQERDDAHAADYEAIDYGLTALLVRAASAAAAPGARPKFVYLSSASSGPN